MEAPRVCKECRQALPEDAPEGLCPVCLAKIALTTEEPTPGASLNVNPLGGQSGPQTRLPPAPADLAAQFPQLEIIQLIGMGGMGMVYKARQPRLDRLVALKILPMDSAVHPSFAERFNREAKALAKLNHPGIVNVYDFGQTGQDYYFVMEYVDGMNLRGLLKTKTLEPSQALELVTQICAALQFAHDEGVVHRDIKPENILLSKKGQVKIADFGLAKLLGTAPDTALTMLQAAMGTMNYMAPEQRENAQGVDHRADIYSLGVVFYEMLTGEVPMGRFEPPSKRVQVDVRLDEVVLKALEREPARRYQHASEVRTDVESFTEDRHGNQAQPSKCQWPVVATEAGKLLAMTVVIALAMWVLRSAWPLIFLLLDSLGFNRNAGRPQEKRWIKFVRAVSIIGLFGYGVWISKTAWPVVALFCLFDWGKNDKEEEGSDREDLAKPCSGPAYSEPQPKITDGGDVSIALPFKIQPGLRLGGFWRQFSRISGLMRLEVDARVLEFDIKSILPSARKKLQEVRIPYCDIVLADFDSLDRFVLRTARTHSLAELPTSDKGEVTFELSNVLWDTMSKNAAKRFVVALNQRISDQLRRPQ